MVTVGGEEWTCGCARGELPPSSDRVELLLHKTRYLEKADSEIVAIDISVCELLT